MTNEELDRLADLIAQAIAQRAPTPSTWLPVPVRPHTSRPVDPPPVWTGAAQSLSDVAPGPAAPARFRDDIGEATASIRAAAAGHSHRMAETRPASARPPVARAAARGGVIDVPIGVSNRHVHVSETDARTLFGAAALTSERLLAQPGQFAAHQRVHAAGPSGRIEGIRIVGPSRGATQLELAQSDTDRLGVQAPIADSGHLQQSVGGVTLEGPAGKVHLASGVMVAARHLHLSADDGRRWRLRDGDRVVIRCGCDQRLVTWHNVLVRCGPTHATEFHLDIDEARAAGVRSGDRARVLSVAPAVSGRKTLVTERDVVALAARGESLPPGALLTPSARDRARALGLLG